MDLHTFIVHNCSSSSSLFIIVYVLVHHLVLVHRLVHVVVHTLVLLDVLVHLIVNSCYISCIFVLSLFLLGNPRPVGAGCYIQYLMV